MRILFPLIGGPHWLGGRNWLRNLLQVLATHAPGAVQPILLVEDGTDPADLLPFRAIAGTEILPMPPSGDQRVRALKALLRPDPLLADVSRAARADLLFESNGFAGRHFPVPVLSWIPDFQHRHLPQYFPAAVRAQRHLQMLARLSSRRRFMLSSADAEADCLRFYPKSSGRTHVVRFAVQPPDPVSLVQWQDTLARHGLPDAYVYLPNQLWQHKNHELVVAALEQASSGGLPVISTGAERDPRAPAHADRLKQRIADAGLADRFRFLGLVPYADVGTLMAGAQALLNPSRFEGWSTTVEEAKALGVPMLLSSIAVHREQAAHSARFFDPDDAPALAGLLAGIEPLPASAALGRAAAVHDAQIERLRAFAAAFLAAAGAAAASA